MPRTRLFAIAVLPLLATLLAAQAPALPPKPSAKPVAKPAVALPPKKPAALAQKQKTATAAQPKAAAPAAQPKINETKKPDAKKLDAKKPEPPKYALADYYRVWGVGAETTRADIVARFGEPQRTGDSERKPFYYFNDALVFYFTAEDTVGTMIVGNSFEPMPPKAIPPDVIDKAFIGRKRDDVLKTFGPANVVSSENYRYLPKTGAYKVEFQCYDFKGYVCGQMLVQI